MTQTLIELFEQSVAQYPDNICLSDNHGQGYKGITFLDVRQRVLHLAASLQQMGIAKGDRVAILSENRVEWCIADLAVWYCGAIVVTLSTKLIEREDLLVRLQNSGAETLFVSSAQRGKAEEIQGQTDLRRILCFDDASFAGLMGASADGDTVGQEAADYRPVTIEPDDPALIIYTSGTTGNPKGVVLTHRNNVANVENHRSLGDCTPHSSTLAFLPLDHCFFHAFFLMSLANGSNLAMPQPGRTPIESMLNMVQNIQAVHPDFLAVVPAMLQTFRVLLTQHCRGREVTPEAAQQFFGGRLRYLIAGGALTDPETERFYLALGLPIHIGYGMTEATMGVSRSYPAYRRTGSVGRPASLDQEVLIVDEQGEACPVDVSGEILYRGDTVMQGYWRNPEATREVLTVDGWLHTGDMGHLDADGFLYIDGRVKSLLISSTGEKYSPEGIESAIEEASPLIHQMMLYNQQSPCTVAFIVPDKAQLAAALAQRQLTLGTSEGQDAAIGLIADVIRRFRRGGELAGRFPEAWLPVTFALLSEPFSVQNGQLTATQKLVRRRVIAAYRDRLDALFTPSGINPLNEANRRACLEISKS